MFLKQILNKKKALQKAKIHIIKLIYFNVEKVISANKVFIVIISFLIFLWLLNTTFTKKEVEQNLKEVNYKLEREWNYLNIDKDKIVYSNEFSSWSLNIKYLNSFDKIISIPGEIDIKDNQIEIKKWIFLFNISDINNNYEVKWEWFRIITNWPMSFIIDNSWTRTTIFSINSRIDLDLKNIENDKIINSLSLYPNTYIKIIPSQNKNLENADLLRVTQRFTLDYLNQKLLVNDIVNKEFLEKVIWEKEENDIKKIEKLIKFVSLNEESNSQELKKIKNIKIGFILWEKLIKQYHILFVNENKKTIYYKNLIIKTLWDIINSWANEEKNKLLVETLLELKEINTKEYEKIIDIINYYVYIYLNSYENNYENKISISKLYSEISWKKFTFKDKNLISLNDLYFKYNFRNYEKLYYDLNVINYEIWKSIENEVKRSYFIYYLNKIIFSGFKDLDENKKISFEDIIWIFNIYWNNSISYYSIDDNVRIKTWLVEYNNILLKLINQIRISYFKNELDKQWLLVINKENNIWIDKINTLENNMKKILEYYNKNKFILWTTWKDLQIKSEFESSNLKYEEYIFALKDYQSYVANYNEQNKKLLFWETANNSDKNSNDISIENAKKYLEQFNYLDLSNLKISLRWVNYCNNPVWKYDLDWIEEPYCYKIEDLIIWSWMYLNMILSPKEYNNIYNFVINWDKSINRGSYKLDSEKIIWDENYKRASWSRVDEKTKFENFFLYVFNPPKEISDRENTNENNNDKEVIEESVIVRIFKMNKLLWENWDFNIIKWFINIKYENTIVEENNQDFKIFVKNWEIIYESWQVYYKWFLSWEYEFLPWHSFINPSIKFVNKVDTDLYFWNTIKFEWVYNINKIKEELIDVFSNLNNLNNILVSLAEKNGIRNYEIIHKKEENQFYIKNIDNEIEIILKWISLQSVIYNWKQRINKPTPIYDFRNILELIK